MAIWYRGRQIKASPYDKRKWYVYRVRAKGILVLYIGIALKPKKRFKEHKKRFKFKQARKRFVQTGAQVEVGRVATP